MSRPRSARIMVAPVSVSFLVLLFWGGPIRAQECKPTQSGIDKFTKKPFEQWEQSLSGTGFLASMSTTTNLKITGIVTKGGDNEKQISLFITRTDDFRADAPYKAEKGNEFLFGVKDGSPVKFVADEVQNRRATGTNGRATSTLVLQAKLKDEDLASLRTSLAGKTVDAVRIVFADNFTVDASVSEKDGKNFSAKIGCFLERVSKNQ